MPAVVQSAQGEINGATSGFTVTLPGNTTIGNRVVVLIWGNTVTSATPAGWTEREANINFAGNYLYDRAADGGASWAFTNSAGHLAWEVYEIAAGAYVDSTASQATGTVTNLTTVSVTPTAGDRWLIAQIGGVSTSNVITSVASWTNSFIDDFDFGTTNGASESYGGGTATREVAADGVTTYDTNGTYNATCAASGSLIAAYEFTEDSGIEQAITPATEEDMALAAGVATTSPTPTFIVEIGF